MKRPRPENKNDSATALWLGRGKGMIILYLLSCQRQARYNKKKMLQGQQLITLPQELLTKLISLKHPGVGTSYILKCQRINSL